MKRLAILASGTGSLLQYMIERELPVQLVVVDRPCRAREIAEQANIEVREVPRTFGTSFGTTERDVHSEIVARLLVQRDIDIAAMMGYMTYFTKPFFDTYKGLLLNTHPALLPYFPGDTAVKDALEAGVKVTGCTIHEAFLELDSDQHVLAQQAVPILPEDTEKTLHERIKEQERPLYFRILCDLLELDSESA